MLDNLLTEFNDVDELPDADQRRIMVVQRREGGAGEIERFIRRLFLFAISSKSSDVHIEGRGDRDKPAVYIHVRTPKGMKNMLYEGGDGLSFANKIFAVTGTPQGGSTGETISTRFSMTLPAEYARRHGLKPIDGKPYEVDFRVEFMRTFDSFSFVCRLLDQQRTPTLEQLNLPYSILHSIKKAANEPSGLIVASGPTGSGKTTLLNAVLGYLNDTQRSIATIENPVEFRLHGPGPIKQIQVTKDFTFARALRSILRADPDVILVGEIRDRETMEVALEASKTGHIVLTTVHANDAHGTLDRFMDLGADPLSVADSLKLIMAQRLLPCYGRELRERPLTRDEADWMTRNGMGFQKTIRESTSAERSGAKMSVIEAITMDARIKESIRGGQVDSASIYRIARDQDQYESLASAGVRLVESAGCRLSDCMTILETNNDAAAHPSLRIRLAQEHGVSLVQVASAVDATYVSRDQQNSDSLQQILRSIKEADSDADLAVSGT